jgi:hypothetical protein
VAVAGADARLRIIAALDGREVWTVGLPGVADVAPVVARVDARAAHAVLVGTRDGHVVAFDPRARRALWDVATGSAVTGLDAVTREAGGACDVLAVTDDGRLRVLRGSDGAASAAFDLVAATRSVPRIAALGAARQRCVVAVHAACTLVALPMGTGAVAPKNARVFSFSRGSGRWPGR